MRLAIGLTALALGIGLSPASADDDDDDDGGRGRRAEKLWEREREFAKEQRKREEKALKEARKHEEEYRKELRERQEEAWKDARRRQEDDREFGREWRGSEIRYRAYEAPRFRYDAPHRGYGHGYGYGGYESGGHGYVPAPPRPSYNHYDYVEPHFHAEPHGAHYVPQPVPGGVQTITVPFGSDKEQYAEYRVPGRIIDVQFQQASKAPCAAGRTWGYDGDRLWANAGCRGFFTVTFESH